jgi:hypothetical protein
LSAGFRYVPGLIQTCFLFGLPRTVSVIEQNYCIYTQWFESGLQAPKAIKFGHMAQAKTIRLNCLQVALSPQQLRAGLAEGETGIG